ncbi:MAG: 2Fe-2S ferredoxin-like protein [Endozoicomonadaceae bacterium]|nr:2Fe-2S ferredoxin-like protein [Endozoicomonadaceae bacterium]
MSTSIIIYINQYCFSSPKKSKHSLLEVMEDQHIEVNYQCRNGFCGACRMQLLKGKVIYFCEPLAYLAEKSILPCCCRVEEDVILSFCLD